MSRFDMGRAWEALNFDYEIYPREERKQRLLDHLEQAIEPDPVPRPRRTIADLQPSLHTLFVAMGVWLVSGSILRILLQVTHGQNVDFLPIVSLVLGITALITLLRTPPNAGGGA